MAHSSNPRVLFVGHYAGRTGAPMVLLHLLRWLKEHATFDFEILLREGGPLEPEFAKLAPVHNLARPANASGQNRLMKKIQRRLRSSPPPGPLEVFCKNRRWDLVYSNTITNGHIVSHAAANGCLVITHVHEMDYWIQRSGIENFELVKKQTTRFIAAANAVKEALVNRHGIPGERVSVAHEFIPPAAQHHPAESIAHIRKKMGIPAGAFIVGGSGFEFWRKGHDLAVPLLMALKRRNPSHEIHFIWVGDHGNETEKLELAHDLSHAGVESCYHVTGEVSNPFDYFAAMDLFLLLSREDPFPLVCLEAASLGKPVLCFAGAGGMPEFVEDDAGFVLPYLDVEALAERVLFLSKNKEECLRLGRRGAEKVKNNFSVEALAPKILQIIENTIKR